MSAAENGNGSEYRELARLIGEQCRLTGTFKLRSGQESSTYFDKYLFESGDC